MSTLHYTSAHLALARATEAMARLPLAVSHTLSSFARERRALAELNALDDAMLRDIGLTRGDLAGAETWPTVATSTLELEGIAASRVRDQAREMEALSRAYEGRQ